MNNRTKQTIGRRGLIVTAGAALAAPAVVRAQGSGGVGLVIGNSKYQWEASLPNVKRDVPAIAKRFQGLGLKTTLLEDVTRDAMQRAIDAFVASARGANLAALYFAGHGAAWGKDTFLVPIDADLSDPATVKNLVKVASFRDGLSTASHRFLVFDNCRNNPADGWRQQEAADFSGNYIGNAAMSKIPDNTLTLFSTAPGRVAVDGPAGDFSPFASALMRQLDQPQVDLQAMPTALRRDVLMATEGRQVVFDISTYRQPFAIKGAGGKDAAVRGWAVEPGRIVELPNAYAFAQQNNLLLPDGLLAHRPKTKSADAQKVGAYKSTDSTGGPAVFIVLSVEEGSTAEVIASLRERSSGKSGWRFVHGTLSGRSVEFLPSARAKPVQLTWSDANAGRVSILGGAGAGGGSNSKVSSGAPFTRLDG
jgi:hypothetical protein